MGWSVAQNGEKEMSNGQNGAELRLVTPGMAIGPSAGIRVGSGAIALNDEIIATAMFGYDGHRGWLNYFAVLPNFQKRGFGKQLMTFGEMALWNAPILWSMINVNA